MAILNQESSLMEIVKLIGSDVLPDDQKLIIEIARVIRVGFLQQNAYHKDDTYVPLKKQFLMMGLILHLYHGAQAQVSQGVPLSEVVQTGLFEKVIKVKYDIPNDQPELFAVYKKDIDAAFEKLSAAREEGQIA